MNIVCYNCGGKWKSYPPPSLYLELDLTTQPCPKCEAYTLGFQEAVSLGSPAKRSWHLWEKENSRGGCFPTFRSEDFGCGQMD